jgi:gliding motility-associated-like protein/uncharacterized repeat protein (TIGR01451 family)
MAGMAFAQKTRYIQTRTSHALSVPENADYNFEWTIVNEDGSQMNAGSNTHITNTLFWGKTTPYHITVRPVSKADNCYGEPVSLILYPVPFLSLHVFDDIYFTTPGLVVDGNMRDNDFDEQGAAIYYTPTPVVPPKHGTLSILPNGFFTYRPNPGFVGIDSFEYEAYNDLTTPMYANAQVTIVVKENSPQADLKIEKTGPAKALLGKTIDYVISVKNTGTAVAQNVVINDQMPFGVFNPTYRLSEGGIEQEWGGNYQLGSLAVGDSISLYIRGEISVNSPEWLYNQALIYADTYDPQNGDNSSIWATEVSKVYVDLPDSLFVPSCESTVLPALAGGNNPPFAYEWLNSEGLDRNDLLNPVFTPNGQTIGEATEYVLKATDALGNTAFDTLLIIVPDVPVANIQYDTVFVDNGGVPVWVNGANSVGFELEYSWSTANGLIMGNTNSDSIAIASKGAYTLKITDYLGCIATDSVVALWKSHPPIIGIDTIELEAGTEMPINVLLNDRDSNDFNLRVVEIVSPPNHSDFTWDTQGVFTVKPNIDFWLLDSVQYQVCNDGYPSMCSLAWLYIKSNRPPLNADLVLQKTGDRVAFYGDTIHYQLVISSLGPDTVTMVNVFDKIDRNAYNPQFSLNDGATWANWPLDGKYVIDNIELLPNKDTISIAIKANVRPNADREIINTAYISSTIKENNPASDTAVWITKIKQSVVAIAERNVKVGACVKTVSLDASKSKGENITFNWSPSLYLDNSKSATPIFTNPGVQTVVNYWLTVTDDDGVKDSIRVTVTMLPPPVADAGPDRLIEAGQTTILDGRSSSGYTRKFSWSTTDGRFSSSRSAERVLVDTVGHYLLTFTDSVGCADTDDVDVFWYYNPPFAIPDYYSVEPDNSLDGNVLENDKEPNGVFQLKVTPRDFTSTNGGTVRLLGDGQFTYRPKAGFTGIDKFSYQVCNTAIPPRCANGYVQITVMPTSPGANLNIDKTSVLPVAIRNDVDGVEYIIRVRNLGPDAATNVVLTDTVSTKLKDTHYSLDGGLTWPAENKWTGSLFLTPSLDVNQITEVRIRGTVKNEAQGLYVFNAATVVSDNFDANYEWYADKDSKLGNDLNRNVDTVSIKIVSDLIAVAELEEKNPLDNQKFDLSIGACDTMSILTAKNSRGRYISSYQWSPAEYVIDPYAVTTTFSNEAIGKDIEFDLVIFNDSTLTASKTSINVHVSPEVIADAGPDRKINQGEILVLDASNSQAENGIYEWISFDKAPPVIATDPKQPGIQGTGVYSLNLTDMYGCYDKDTVTIRLNELYVISDIIIVIANGTITANVRTNDYDPNFDSIYYTGMVTAGPFHGTLQDNPVNRIPNSGLAPTPNKISENGTFVYTPNRNYIGFDYFRYEVCDDNEPDLCVEGIVYIKVINVDLVNSTPVANHDHFFVQAGDTIETNLLANDYDFDGGFVLADNNLNQTMLQGRAQLDKAGTLRFIADTTAYGSDQFFYTICDNGKPQKCDTASVTIDYYRLNNINNKPIAGDDAYYSVEKAIYGNVLKNDFDPENDLLQLNVLPVYGPLHGDFQMDQYGDFTYLPDVGFEGTDIIVYELCEMETKEQHCSQATIYITNIAEKRYTTDASIVKSTPNPVVMSGTTITYSLSAKINGPTLANDVVVRDTLYSRLTNRQYSLDRGVTWRPWNLSEKSDQLLLYADSTLLVRGDIPKIFQGDLVNTAWISHDMNEKDPANNRSRIVTKVLQRVIANAGPDTVLGSCITVYELDGEASVGLGKLNYQWISDPPGLLENANTSKPLFTTEPGERRTFTLIVSSTSDGLSHSDTTHVTIDVAPKPVARAGENIWPTTISPVKLDGSKSSGIGPLAYRWWYYDKNKNAVIVGNTETVMVQRSNEYFLTVTDAYGCENTDNVYVTYPLDEYVAKDDYVVTYQQQSIDIYPLRNDSIDSDDVYNLDRFIILEYPKHGQLVSFMGDSFLTYIPDIYYFGLDTFSYSSTTLSNTSAANVYITVEKRDPIIPEGFSPNGDGINDTWIIENIDLYEFNSVVVLNRWGNIIYEKQKYSNSDPWDGKANKGIRLGKGVVPTGVYLYIVKLGDHELIKTRDQSGTIYVASDN